MQSLELNREVARGKLIPTRTVVENAKELMIEADPSTGSHQLISEMDSVDISADLTALPTARLLSESPLIGRSDHIDLSSSDLPSVHDLPQDDHDRTQSHAADDEHDEDEVAEGLREEGEEGEEAQGEGEDEEAEIRRARKAARTREEKLQNDLFLLKKLNGAFSLYTDALRATQSSTEVSRYSTFSHLHI